MLMRVGRTSSGALAAVLIGGCVVAAAVAAVSAMPAAEPAPTAIPIAVPASARATFIVAAVDSGRGAVDTTHRCDVSAARCQIR